MINEAIEAATSSSPTRCCPARRAAAPPITPRIALHWRVDSAVIPTFLSLSRHFTCYRLIEASNLRYYFLLIIRPQP